MKVLLCPLPTANPNFPSQALHGNESLDRADGRREEVLPSSALDPFILSITQLKSWLIRRIRPVSREKPRCSPSVLWLSIRLVALPDNGINAWQRVFREDELGVIRPR